MNWRVRKGHERLRNRTSPDLRGGGYPDCPGISKAGADGAARDAHGGVATGLAGKRPGEGEGAGLVETISSPKGSFDCDLPATRGRRGIRRRGDGGIVLADEGERGGGARGETEAL